MTQHRALHAVSRRSFLGLAAGSLLAGSLGLAGCKPASPLRIASQVWPGYEFMFLARNQGWLDTKDVQLMESQSATESLRWLAEGRTDGAALTLDEVLIGLKQGMPLSVVLLFDISAGADAVLAKPQFKTAADLKGGRIGVETSALGKLMLHKFMQHAGLEAGQLQVENLAINDHVRAWQRGQLDAIITYEPSVSVIEHGGAVRLFDSIEIPDTIFDVLAVHRERADSHAGALKALIRGHFQGLQAWKTNPVDTAYRMARRLDLPANRVREMYHGIELPDLAYNRHMLGAGAVKLAAVARDLCGILGFAPDLVDAGLFQARYLD